jgi:hypothetical protein
MKPSDRRHTDMQSFQGSSIENVPLRTTNFTSTLPDASPAFNVKRLSTIAAPWSTTYTILIGIAQLNYGRKIWHVCSIVWDAVLQVLVIRLVPIVKRYGYIAGDDDEVMLMM